MSKPYRMSDAAGKHINAPKPVVAPDKGKAVFESQKTGQPLPTGDKDIADAAQIPWPQPVNGVPKTPFKNTK